jgi:hypothetical protein
MVKPRSPPVPKTSRPFHSAGPRSTTPAKSRPGVRGRVVASIAQPDAFRQGERSHHRAQRRPKGGAQSRDTRDCAQRVSQPAPIQSGRSWYRVRRGSIAHGQAKPNLLGMRPAAQEAALRTAARLHLLRIGLDTRSECSAREPPVVTCPHRPGTVRVPREHRLVSNTKLHPYAHASGGVVHPNAKFEWTVVLANGAAIRDGLIGGQIQIGASSIGPFVTGWGRASEASSSRR